MDILMGLAPPSPYRAIMRQWIGSALVQIMACHEYLGSNFNDPNHKIFINENASENVVCKIVAILSRGWVKNTQNY